MKFLKQNIFQALPDTTKEEIIEEIINSGNCRIERIVSEGQSSPENFWYEQDENEFVLLLKGSAVIEFSDNTATPLTEGDYIFIPKLMKHRVKETSASAKTIWLAIFFSD